MKVNRINNNTIRVQINKEELERRGLKVLDLLGNKEKIQHFFYSILAEIDAGKTFTKDAPVTFQIMPSNGGLDVLITKVKEGEVGSNLQKMLGDKFNQSEDEDDSRRTFFDLNPDDDAKTELDPQLASQDGGFSSQKDKQDYWKFQNCQYYKFNDLGEAAELTDSLHVSDLASSLYLYEGEFYLKLAFLDENYSELKPADAWAIANEYGIKVNAAKMNQVKINGKCLLRQDALGNLRRYFYQVRD